ncbi:MAG: hypothetical protein DVB32_10680 [Verrucomicrobia bacterium]|nr:MAG: hypothetical protein DVB32_10680 [Verrucomicrobiota bacterium]
MSESDPEAATPMRGWKAISLKIPRLSRRVRNKGLVCPLFSPSSTCHDLTPDPSSPHRDGRRAVAVGRAGDLIAHPLAAEFANRKQFTT